nr:GNAT family N-acetyltransferase [uncultured Niameybacter sp.]
MDSTIKVKRKDGLEVTLTLEKLDKSYIEKIIQLQEEILGGIDNPEIFVPTSKEEFHERFETDATFLGYVTEENELIALIIFLKLGYDPDNYGYDLDLEGEVLLDIGQVDTVLVKEDFRGNNLQYILGQAAEALAREVGSKILCATVSPDNPFSLNNFKKLGYEIKKDKLKYGGVRRYILMKELV